MNHSHSAAGRHAGRLAAAIGVSALVLVVELVAGLVGNSLALLADAGHVFADASGMGLSFAAVWVAARPPTGRRSFGLYRLEIVAATANAILLLGIAVVVLFEASQRFGAPPDVQPGIVSAVAAFALLANLVSLRLLAIGKSASLTLRGAYLEVAGDLLGAGAVLVAGLVILATGWRQADAVASIVIAVLIVPRALALLRDSLDVLLEATPKGIDMAEVERHIREAPGVRDVHDLHAWTITSGMNVVSAHVVLGPEGRARGRPRPPRRMPLRRLRHQPLDVPARNPGARRLGGAVRAAAALVSPSAAVAVRASATAALYHPNLARL